ncbi:MAG: tetratricopeptide repeat protein [Pseudomonadota bacterium]
MKNVITAAFVVFALLCATSVSIAQETSCIGLYSIADTLYKQGKWSAACQVGRQALDKAKTSGTPYQPTAIKTMVLLADLKRDLGQPADARILTSAAHDASTARFGPNHPYTMKTLIRSAELAERRSDGETAKKLYGRAISASREGGDDVTVAPALIGMAGICRKEGRADEAEALYKRALEVYETARKYRPYLDGNIAQIRCDIAGINRERDNYAEASENYRKSLAKCNLVYGSHSMNAADTRVRLGDAYMGWGKPARAERQYRKALAAYQRLSGANDIKTALILKRLGDLYLAKNNFPKAERSYTQAVAVLKKCSPTCSATLTSAMKALDDLRMKRGDRAEAPLHQSVSGQFSTGPAV